MRKTKHFKYQACASMLFFCSNTYAEMSKQNTAGPNDANDYVFDPSLFKGAGFNLSALKTLSRANTMLPGNYNFETYLNNKYLGSYLVNILDGNQPVKACLPIELLREIGFKKKRILDVNSSSQCFLLSDVSPDSSEKIDPARLKLDLSVPQILLDLKPRGYIDPANYTTGQTIGFVNYLANLYHVDYNSQQKNLNSAWLSLQGGINFASWQYRQQTNLTWNQSTGAQWRTSNRYLQRPIVSLASQLMAGQLVTNGFFLSGLSFNGINLQSDDAMLPESQRGYAPIIKGIATTNATVSVSQNKQNIYQTTVPPGAFIINDLYPTSYSGDLLVTVKEATGSEKTFTVPYSSLPESIRPGLSHYNLAVGETRDTEKKTNFVDVVYQRGLTNTLSSNQAIRVAPNYLAAMLGGVYTSSLGSIGFDGTFSHAKLMTNSKKQGWMAHLYWSKVINASRTTITLAGYRYSSEGYRDLAQILGLGDEYNSTLSVPDYRHLQHERFDLSLNQDLGRYGAISASSSLQSYRYQSSKDTQLQLGYSKYLANGVNLAITVTKQLVGNGDEAKKSETATSISLSIPLMPESPRSVSLSTSYNHSDSGGDQYQVDATGSLDDETNSSYTLSASANAGLESSSLAGSLQRQFANSQLGLTASTGQGFWQASGDVQGGLAIHSGGLTFGPYLSNTFAIVEAKGATGTKIANGYRSVIDSHGYALIPSLIPYHRNSIVLDSDDIAGNTELLDSQKKVVPVAGAAVKLVFRTRTGYALLINTHVDNSKVIPIGAEVYDMKNNLLGIAGQGGQIYVRVSTISGTLHVQWSEDKAPCLIYYQLNNKQIQQALINIKTRCSVVSK